MDLNSAVELSLGWLTRSDVRCAREGSAGHGGVMQGYNWQERSYPFVYSEITGYAVSALVNAYRWTGEGEYLRLARESAGFLLRAPNGSGGGSTRGAVLHSLSVPDLRWRQQLYSFDAAMCLQGLLDLNAVVPRPEVRERAEAIGRWLVAEMQQESGAFLAMRDAGSGEWSPSDEGDQFGDGGCLHAKHAIGLLKLGAATGEERYVDAARRVCDWVLGLQDDDGAFRTTERMEQVVSHTHCYATEGLLFAHSVLGREDYLDAARRAGRWLLSVQNRDGSISIAHKRRWWRMGRHVTEKVFPRRVTDATAQAIRIWLSLYGLHDDPRYLDACRRAAAFLLEMQCTSSPDRNAVGGLYFWPGHPMMYTWSAMFAIDALYSLAHFDRKQAYQSMMKELF